MSSATDRVPCPRCSARAHRTKEYADAAKRLPAREFVTCRVCGYDSRTAAALLTLAGVEGE